MSGFALLPFGGAIYIYILNAALKRLTFHCSLKRYPPAGVRAVPLGLLTASSTPPVLPWLLASSLCFPSVTDLPKSSAAISCLLTVSSVLVN